MLSLFIQDFFTRIRPRNAVCGWVDKKVNEFVFVFFHV